VTRVPPRMTQEFMAECYLGTTTAQQLHACHTMLAIVAMALAVTKVAAVVLVRQNHISNCALFKFSP